MRLIPASIFIFSFLLLSSISLAAVEFTVGVSPQVVEMGELERGSSNIVKFYIVTPSTEPLLVYLEPERSNLDFFSKDQYKQLIFNYSEDDVVSYVEFLKNPVELVSGNETLKTSYGEIRGWREINFLLNVPKDAEPGYHTVKINPIPTVPSEAMGQAGARVVAVTSVTLLFSVPGDARREGIILDVVAGGYSGKRLEMDTYFQNTGTMTISARAEQNFYVNNETIVNITSPIEFVKPGEIKILKAFLPAEGISVGDYNVSTKVSYTTGYTSKNSTVSITKAVEVSITPEVYPWWIVVVIILVIIAIAICIYKWYK